MSRHALSQRDPFGVHRHQVFGLQHPGHGAAADEPAVEAGALLVGEHDGLYGMAGRRGLFSAQRLHDFDGPHHAEGAVVLAAQGDGVGVGAQGDGREGVDGPGFAPDDVAGGVDAHVQPGLAHQVHGVLAALHVGRREGEAVHSLRRLAELSQFVEGLVQARSVDGECGHGVLSPL